MTAARRTRDRSARSVRRSAAPLRWIPVLLLFLASCRPTRSPVAARSAEDVLRALVAADNRGDVDAVASLYAEDAVLLPPNAAPVVGRSEIRERYAAGFARFQLRVELRQTGFRSSGGLAYSHGTTEGEFVWLDGSPATRFHDTYLMTLTRDDAGRWKVAALMWSPLEAASEQRGQSASVSTSRPTPRSTE